MLRIYFCIGILGWLSLNNLVAQQTPQTVLFMYNQMLYNPAAAGMQETNFNLNLINRLQWGGKSNGGPVTSLLWSDYRFSGNKTAIGINLGYDKFGATGSLDAMANYAYYVPLTRKLKLAMGLRAGVNNATLNTIGLTAWDENDPIIGAGDISVVSPKVGAGFQLVSKRFYGGFSVPDIIGSDNYNLYGNRDLSFSKKKRNYMLMSGYKFRVNDSYNFFPNVRILYYPGTATRIDFNALLEITDYFWTGLTYSTSNNHAVMVGTHISSRIRFAYSYEFNTKVGSVGLLSTHELNLMMNLDNLLKRK